MEKNKNKKYYCRGQSAVTLSHMPVTLTDSKGEGVTKGLSV